jgi:type IV secretory pathway VirD2 relaxase
MVYTKHFQIHNANKLEQSKDYVENAEKTLIAKRTNHLDNLFPYIAGDNKTMFKQLVSGHRVIDVFNAANEFMLTKELMSRKKGTHINFDSKTGQIFFDKTSMERKDNRGKAVLAHHLIQSFSPDDQLTAEVVHELGRKTMLEFTGGEYEFVIATHIDKEHIHNHIIMNHTNAVTGKVFPWRITEDRNGKKKDRSKELFEQISDKIASKVGAKIIERSPRNSHTKYTKYQTEKIFKSKIKQRLDFLLAHSHDIEDFKLKANTLNLHVDFSGKWAKYRLIDSTQVKNTRGRTLNKEDETRYNEDRISKRLKDNVIHFSIEDVVEQYKEKISFVSNDFDYQVTVEPWQIDHVTEKGYYLNVDFGIERHGQIFMPGYKVDPLENGDYLLYLRKSDSFYFMNEADGRKNRFMRGNRLVKQLSLYNGTVPLVKEPVISTMKSVVSALNFLASHDVTEGRQLEGLEKQLLEAFEEAKSKLFELDEKIIELTQVAKTHIEDEGEFQEIRFKLKQVKLGRGILQEVYDDTVKEVNEFYGLRAGIEDLNKDENHSY